MEREREATDSGSVGRDADSAPVIFEDAYYARLHDVERRHGWFRGLRAVSVSMLRSAGIRAPGMFVDAGCGTGAVLGLVAGRLGAVRAVGLDLAFEGLQRCRADGLRLVANAGVEALPLADGSADIVHCADVLQHLAPDVDRRFAGEAARVLRSGGVLYLRTVRRQHPPPAFRPGDPHYHQYSLAEVAALCADAGLRPEVLTTVNVLPGLKSRWRRRRPKSGPAIPERSPREPMNSVLHGLLAMEGWILARTRWQCRWGLSIVCVARKA